jgi:hypothetical protein
MIRGKEVGPSLGEMIFSAPMPANAGDASGIVEY